jgi:hypothetical protein
MEQALAQKEKSSYFQQVNEFFGKEVPNEYVPKIKECFADLKQSKDYKLKLFEEKKRLNEVDYENSQKELQLKQELDEKFKTLKNQLDKEA